MSTPDYPRTQAQRRGRHTPAAVSSLRLERHAAGLTSTEMGQLEGVGGGVIREWLCRRGLQPNLKKRTPSGRKCKALDEHAAKRRLDLYNSGLTDAEIARREGVDRTCIGGWRRRNQLQRHRGRFGPFISGQRAARLFLYALGYTDRMIAKEQGVGADSVACWRYRMGLPSVRSTTSDQARRGPKAIMTRIAKAVGTRLAIDIAADAVADLYLDVCSGKVSVDSIEKEARRYGNRVLEKFASKYGPRSIDEEISDGGFTLLDTMADERESNWLEEMGATVW